MAEKIKEISVDGIKYNLKKLQERGLIKHEGPDRGGKWIVLVEIEDI